MPSRSNPKSEIAPGLIKACAALCPVLAIALPAAVAISWISGGHPPGWPVKAPPPDALRPLGAAIAVVPSLILARGLWLARRALLRFGRNDFFSVETATDLRGFACWSFLAPLAGLLTPTVVALALTLGNPPGHRILAFSISVNSEQLVGLLVAGMFWIVGGVLLKGAQLAEENRQFV